MGDTEKPSTLDETWCRNCPFRDLPPFDRLIEPELARLEVRPGKLRTAAAGTQLIREGDAASRVYFLCSGWAMRSQRLPDGRQLNIQFQLPGDIFGYGVALLGLPAYYSTEALTSITYQVLERERVAALPTASPDLARKFMLRMARRIRADDFRMLNLARRKVEERLASFLLYLFAHLHRLKLAEDHAFDFPLSQQHIADAIGTHPVHINRVLRRLRETGLVTVQERQVRIHDLAGLRRFGCFCDDPERHRRRARPPLNCPIATNKD